MGASLLSLFCEQPDNPPLNHLFPRSRGPQVHSQNPLHSLLISKYSMVDSSTGCLSLRQESPFLGFPILMHIFIRVLSEVLYNSMSLGNVTVHLLNPYTAPFLSAKFVPDANQVRWDRNPRWFQRAWDIPRYSHLRVFFIPVSPERLRFSG